MTKEEMLKRLDEIRNLSALSQDIAKEAQEKTASLER